MRPFPVKKNGWLGALLCAVLCACGHASNAPTTAAVESEVFSFNDKTGIATLYSKSCPSLGQLAFYFFCQGVDPIPIAIMVTPDGQRNPLTEVEAEEWIVNLYEHQEGLRGIAIYCAFRDVP